ncbi:MAG: acetolactate synthase small subunit, partial [Thermodesulfobacteriota bacterium]
VRVEREMVLIKVDAPKDSRSEIYRISKIFRAKVVDLSAKTYTLELTGDIEKVSAFIEMLSQFGIKEIARTGTVALARENKKNK